MKPSKCPTCGHSATPEPSAMEISVEAEPLGKDSETAVKDELLSELIEVMQGSVGSRFKKPKDEDEEY